MNEDPTYPISVPLSFPRLLKLSPYIADDQAVINKDTFLIQYPMDLSLEVRSSPRKHIYTWGAFWVIANDSITLYRHGYCNLKPVSMQETSLTSARAIVP